MCMSVEGTGCNSDPPFLSVTLQSVNQSVSELITTTTPMRPHSKITHALYAQEHKPNCSFKSAKVKGEQRGKEGGKPVIATVESQIATLELPVCGYIS